VLEAYFELQAPVPRIVRRVDSYQLGPQVRLPGVGQGAKAFCELLSLGDATPPSNR
jgi:hypothetical protein